MMVLNMHEANMIAEPEISQETIQYFRDRYGNRFIRALRAVEEGNVKLYTFQPSGTSLWVVSGREHDYLVMPSVFCSCRSFYQDVVIARKAPFCYHLLAQRIAEIRGQYKTINESDSARRSLLAMLRNAV
ncbi:MAG: hypothetical protein ACTSVD_04405 [Candidatus Thorarchaeota archaeon]